MLKNRILFINNSSKLGLGTSVSLLLLLKYLSKDFDCTVASDRQSKQLPAALDKLNIGHYALPDRLIFYLASIIAPCPTLGLVFISFPKRVALLGRKMDATRAVLLDADHVFERDSLDL